MSGWWCSISHLFQSNSQHRDQPTENNRDGAITDIAQSSLLKGGIEWWGWNSGQDLGVGGCSRQENRWRNCSRFHKRLSTRVHEFLIPIPSLGQGGSSVICAAFPKLAVLGSSSVSSHWVKREIPCSAGWDGVFAQKIKKRLFRAEVGLGFLFACLDFGFCFEMVRQ